ncbi:MAG: DUF5906 domain-containing protein [Cetobacterium sp.]
MAKFNYKKILNSGTETFIQAFNACKFERVKSVRDNIRFVFNEKDFDLTLGKIKGTVESEDGNSWELEAFLKSYGKLDSFMDFIENAIEDDEDDSAREITLENYAKIVDECIVSDDIVYIFNGKFYEIKKITDIETDIYINVLESTGEHLQDRAIEDIGKTALRFLKSKSNKYELRLDNSYKEVVPLAFNNGTLYITKDGIDFKKDKWSKKDKLFYKFNVDFGNKSNGIVKTWLENRFEASNEFNDRLAFVSLLGDLFITNNFSQVMPYFWGEGGTGKSLFLESIGNLLNKKAVSNVNLKDVGNDFKIVPLFESAINITSEVNRKEISSDCFKSVIARDKMQMNQKFKATSSGTPVAKWIGTGNTQPTIEMDSGVARRLLPILIKGKKIEEFNGKPITKSIFEDLFFEDKQGLIEIIIEGITNLFNFGFDLNVIYEEFANPNHTKELKISNDSLEFFYEECTEKIKNDEKTGILKEQLFEAFEFFRKTIKGTGISQMKMQTFLSRIKEMGIKEYRDNYVCSDTGARKQAPRYFRGIRFKDTFLKELSDSNINFTCYHIEQYSRPLINKDDEELAF